MLKKLLLIVVVLALLAGGVWFWMSSRQEDMAAHLPANPLIYLHVNDVDGQWDEWTKTGLWSALSEINLEHLATLSGDPNQQAAFQQLRANLEELGRQEWLPRLFGQEFSVAAYPADLDLALEGDASTRVYAHIVNALVGQTYITTRIDPTVQVAESLTGMFGPVGSDFTQTSTQYREYPIQTLTSPDGWSASYVRLQDLLVISGSEDAIKKALDVHEGVSPALVDSERWKTAGSHWLDGAGTYGLLQMDRMLAYLNHQMGDLVSFSRQLSYQSEAPATSQEELTAYEKQWQDFTSRLQGVDWIVFSDRWPEETHLQGKWFLSPEKMTAFQAESLTCPSQKNGSLAFVPQDLLFYQWGNCFKASAYWDELMRQLRTEAGDGEEMAAFRQQVQGLESALGMSIENDLLPMLGEENGIFITDIQVQGFFPLPDFVFFQKLQDVGKAEQVLERLMQSPFLMMQEENHGEHKIRYMALPLGEALQPSYVMSGGYLLIATNRTLLKQTLDVMTGSVPALRDAAAVTELGLSPMEDARSLQYIRVGALMERVQGLVQWGEQWLNAKTRKEEAFHAGSERRLEEALLEAATLQENVEQLEASIAAVQERISEYTTAGMDIASQQEELQRLEGEREALTGEIGDVETQIETLTETVKGFEPPALSVAAQSTLLNELVYPFLNALKKVPEVGSQMIYRDNMLQQDIYFRLSP